MSGVNPNFICHKLSISSKAKPIAQRKRKLGEEIRQVVQKESEKLIKADFIREIEYFTWLSNVVMVKKSNGKWRTCVDYIDLNKTFRKDAYPLPNIDKLFDGACENQMLSFLDAYLSYNQIKM